MQTRSTLLLGAVCAVVLTFTAPHAAADPVIADVNGSATPSDFIFGTDNAGWKWAATESFTLTGLGSTFHSCCEFNVLSPSQATLLIATDSPAMGGTTLFSGRLDSAGHASFADIAISAGTTYFIGYSGLTGPPHSNTGVGLNIANFIPKQAQGTVNLDGWYHGLSFADFSPQIDNGVLNVFSAPILRFEGHVLAPPPVPEPQTYALMLAGLALMGTALRKRQAIGG